MVAAMHKVIYAVLCTVLPGKDEDDNRYLVPSFSFFSMVNPSSGQLEPVNNSSPVLAHLDFLLRACAYQEALLEEASDINNNPGDPAPDGAAQRPTLDSITFRIASTWLTATDQGQYHPCRWLREQLSTAMSFIATTPSGAKVDVIPETKALVYQGVEITVSKMITLIKTMSNRLEQLLEELLLGYPRNYFPLTQKICDDRHVAGVGHSFLGAICCRETHEKELVRRFLLHPNKDTSLGFICEDTHGRRKLGLHHARCQQWLDSYRELEALQMTLKFLTAGGPPRGTELETETYRNKPGSIRTLTVLGNEILSILRYNKTGSKLVLFSLFLLLTHISAGNRARLSTTTQQLHHFRLDILEAGPQYHNENHGWRRRGLSISHTLCQWANDLNL